MRFTTSKIFILLFGYAFLYIPMAVVIAYSFNASDSVHVWTGFSTQWYTTLLQNKILLNAAWTSLKVATSAATLSTILGLLIALSLRMHQRFRGKSLMGASVAALLVVPDVILGLALLLTFVTLEQWLGWFGGGRGIATITIAHTTFTVAYVTTLVQARLAGLNKDLIEAALDLGATPLQAFWSVTLPLIAPSLLSGWFLAFALSLDDVVVASFVAGPQSTTLPMVIFSQIKFGLSPQVNALATLMIGLVFVGLAISGYFLYRARKQ